MPPTRSTRGISSISKPAVIWIPPFYSCIWKFTIERSDGTVDDLTNYLTSLTVEDGTTETIGSFEFELYNPNEEWTGVWSATNIVKYYKDYSSEATSLRFRGRVEKVSYDKNKIRVSGRSDSFKAMEITVTKSYSSKTGSYIINDLFETYLPEFTRNNVEETTTTISINWVNKPFWEAVKEICTACTYEIYIDKNVDVNFFANNSRENVTDAIVHSYNLTDVNGFGNDTSQVKNKIVIYGAIVDGIQTIYTAEDTTSQTNNFLREKIVEDSNITSYDQAKNYGDYLLAAEKDAPQEGTVTSLGVLATIQPGEKIRISSPDDNIPFQFYKIVRYKDTINNEDGEYSTELAINKETRSVSHILRNIIVNASDSVDTALNPYQLEHSYNFTFDGDSGQHNNTQITSGTLNLVTGSSGTWISPSRTTPNYITRCYLNVIGQTLTGATFYVSGDGGSTWESITNKTITTLQDSIGKLLKVKVVISAATTQIDSLSILYNME